MTERTVNVVNDVGVEVEIPQSEFWIYDEDGLPHWITPQEHAEQEGLTDIIYDTHDVETEKNTGEYDG